MRRGHRRFVLAFAGILAIALLGGVCGWWSAHRARAELAEKWARRIWDPDPFYHNCDGIWSTVQQNVEHPKMNKDPFRDISPKILFEDAKLAIRSGNVTRVRYYIEALRRQNSIGNDKLIDKLIKLSPKDDQGR